MQVTETSADGLKREFRITVPADELEGEISKRLDELGRAIRMPGFRPGKVPMPLLRRRYGSAVRGEVLEQQVQSTSAEAMQQHNLRPALPPRVEIVSSDEGADLEYKMSVELLPDMPPLDFSDLGIEKLVPDVPAEDIDKAVERLAEQQRKAAPVERAAANGDIVVMDFVGRIAEVEFPGGKGENISLELGSGQFVPGFEEQLVGAAANDKRQVSVTFPADYGNAELAGKDAVFDVTVKEVREREPAKTGDELAKEVGLETLAELRQEVEQRMQRDYAGVARQRLKRDLLDKLAARYDFAVPPGMVEMEYETIIRQYEAEKAIEAGRAPDGPAAEGTEGVPAAAGTEGDAPAVEAGAGAEAEALSTGETPEDEEKTKAEFRQIAERRVRLGLLLAEVGRNNNITVSQEELNQALAREARRHPGYERQVIDYYRKNPDAVGNLRAPIYEEKVVDFIVEMAKLSERKVSPAELMRLPDPDEATASAGA